MASNPTATTSLPALRLVHREGPVTMRPNADRSAVRIYPGGHVWRVNREHVERVLDAKAAMPDQMRLSLNAEKQT